MAVKEKQRSGKGTMIPCKSCGEPIAANAKFCPHCGAKHRMPIYKRVWFWVILVILVLAVAGGSGGDTPSDTASPSVSVKPAAEAPAAPVEKSLYQVGDTLRSGDLEIVYVASGEYVSANEYIQPAEGNQFIFMTFAFINSSAKSDASVSMYSFEGYADGYNVQMQYFDEDLLSATLSAGRATSGTIYFEVPKNAKEIEVEYTENIVSGKKVKFAYAGNRDSGYVLSGSASATEGAYQVGQSAESKALKITYLSCTPDDSGNPFITPKEGCHFLTCEFEFENLSESDQTISVYSFDCYADGINCDASYFRDDALNATLSAGRKAKGTVTFSVPDDASVVEVEYLSNFWTSNRVVFNAKVQ